MKSDKIYEFYGVDAKTELRISIIAGIVALLAMIILLFINDKFFKHYSSYTANTNLLLAGLALYGSSVIIKYLGKKYRKLWTLEKWRDKIIIQYGGLTREMFLDKILKIKILGNTQFRYFTVIDESEQVRIRVGTSWLTPFSREGDLHKLDSFVKQELIPYLDKNFTKKDKHPFLGIYTRNKGVIFNTPDFR